jgi:hypothetical protein
MVKLRRLQKVSWIWRSMMADDRSKRGAADRERVAGGEGYEVEYFARKHGITKDQAESLINQIGNHRERLDAAARKLSK